MCNTQTDYSKFPNPYDFAHPVSTRELFSGREDELKTIKYYLSEASKTKQPMNLALLGPRAAGKTSLLNMIEIDSKKRGFCTVRINLNESDTASALSFFFKLFDSIFYNICEFDKSDDPASTDYCFGGLSGKIFETYLDITSQFETNIDKQWCPFIFPTQYAKAQAKGIDPKQVIISDHILQRDLERLQNECVQPIIVLFDECDCLTPNVELLEMLRNIFMNMKGYMLVFAGLPKLFPMMNDVFSPIIRQFKRIEIGAFISDSDTKICINKPLENLGVEPEDIFSDETYYDVHDLTNGRPYEINLICHFLFRRIQEKKAPLMTLNFGVLEDVRRELEKEQDISERPILHAITQLDTSLLRDLGFFTSCDGRATFDQLWRIKHIKSQADKKRKDDLLGALEILKKKGILTMLESGEVKFVGDDFDRIYTKYYARNKEVALNFFDIPLYNYALISFRANLIRKTDDYDLSILGTERYSDPSDPNLSDIAQLMGGTDDETQDIYVSEPSHLFDLFQIATDCTQERKTDLLKLLIETPDYSILTYIHITRPKERNEAHKVLMERIEQAHVRAKEVESKLSVETIHLQFPPLQDILNSVAKSKNENFRKYAASYHVDNMVRHYLRDHDETSALHHADIALQIDPILNPEALNNIGYLLMKTNSDMKRAEECFLLSIETAAESTACLCIYNHSVLLSMTNKKGEALQKTKVLLEKLESIPETDLGVACILAPLIDEEAGDLSFVETDELNIKQAAELLHKILTDYRGKTLSANMCL